ncbi:cholecystokinin receptor type A-like isoform X2 [Daphnia carinata]|uniref:cholecystokinin receptor type A-like isoform X2 n=1 Tax=Daphnia carinata TaxID=120202 RepID=UPI00257BCC01|nr:cholecystokinin receptor type A-like isoform X2 [Daphnia carinata]
MLCSSSRNDALANCQTVRSNNDHSNGTDNNYINETETSVGFSFADGASSRTTPKAINDSDIAFDGGTTISNWSDLFATAGSALAGPGSNATLTAGGGAASGGFGAEVMIPLYSVIFILSVLGNILVIVTLTQNRRMRTVTNVFLLNLAIADLLLGVFCMPFTLIGQLLRDFIFGSFMCKIIPYFQAVSVAVGVWTLVAISLERYFAICRPLKSRIWQTRSHAYKMIIAVWILSLSLCLPVAILSRLKPIRETGRHKCREEWPDAVSEKAYNLLLDVILLVLPLLIMGLAYWLIAARLWRGLRHETGGNSSTNNCSRLQIMMAADVTAPLTNVCGSSCTERYQEPETSIQSDMMTSQQSYPRTSPNAAKKSTVIQWPLRSNHRRLCCHPQVERSVTHQQRSGNEIAWRGGSQSQQGNQQRATSTTVQIMDYRLAARYGVRSTYTDKSVWAKKKVIRMLFVIVFEFFLCWAPLYVVNTWYTFDPTSLYEQMGPTEIALTQLLAYLSSCCNPITYCFMNEKFRNAFLSAFGCGPQGRGFGRAPNRSTDLLSASFNDSFNLGRRTTNKSQQRDRHLVLLLQETHV